MRDWTLDEIGERLQALADAPETLQRMAADFFGTSLRFLWHLHLNPTTDVQQTKERLAASFVPFVPRSIGGQIEAAVLRKFVIEELIGDDLDEDEFAPLFSGSFEDYVKKELLSLGDEESIEQETFLSVWRGWRPRIISLTPTLVSSIRIEGDVVD